MVDPEKPTREKSQNLEVVSNRNDKPPSRDEKRRRPRISLSSEQFRLGTNGKLYSVMDLSQEGMAFRVLERNDLLILPIQMRIEGILNLRGERFFTKAKVIRVTGPAVGCRFEENPEATVAALDRFLNPELLGKELRPIPASAVEGTYWYHGPSGTDLLLQRGVDGQFRKFTLYLLGSYMQWDEKEGLVTGRATSSAHRSDFRLEAWGIVQFECMVMAPDEAPDPQKLAIAKALVLSSNLPEDSRKWCTQRLEQA